MNLVSEKTIEYLVSENILTYTMCMSNNDEDKRIEVLMIEDQATPRYSADRWEALADDGYSLSLSSACNECGYSLTHCPCTILGLTPRVVHPKGGTTTVRMVIRG